MELVVGGGPEAAEAAAATNGWNQSMDGWMDASRNGKVVLRKGRIINQPTYNTVQYRSSSIEGLQQIITCQLQP
jgi:hypothetical protein